MTLEEKLIEIRDMNIPTAAKVSLLTDVLILDLFSTISLGLKGVSENDRLSEDCYRKSQTVQDDVET